MARRTCHTDRNLNGARRCCRGARPPPPPSESYPWGGGGLRPRRHASGLRVGGHGIRPVDCSAREQITLRITISERQNGAVAQATWSKRCKALHWHLTATDGWRSSPDAGKRPDARSRVKTASPSGTAQASGEEAGRRAGAASSRRSEATIRQRADSQSQPARGRKARTRGGREGCPGRRIGRTSRLGNAPEDVSHAASANVTRYRCKETPWSCCAAYVASFAPASRRCRCH